MAKFSESEVEAAALDWLAELGWSVVHGPDIAPGELKAERAEYRQVTLDGRLRAALARLNPGVPEAALADGFRKLTQPDGADLIAVNRGVHRLLVNGVNVEFTRPDGSIGGTQLVVLDFDDPKNNDWVAVNQFTVVEQKHERRPDVVLFVNGLPLAVLELKNAASATADVWAAFRQLQTYKQQIPSLFAFNEALVISDGLTARVGTLTADQERFMPWRTVEGEALAPPTALELEVVLRGAFDRARFLALVRHFVVFEDEGQGVVRKKMAGYHQFHAVNAAVEETIRASMVGKPERVRETGGRYAAGHQPGGEPGDRRVGVVWHTQGSGKSLTMAFYAGRVILHPAMANPTLVVLTDRNDLDSQLFGVFSRCGELLRQEPEQAESRAALREKLQVASGGVIFTTIQKFMTEAGSGPPTLTDRRNVVVIADEAHRSQYDFIDGFAAHMRDALPNASFIGFTGTPVEKGDANTRAVFGDYISVYDIQRAVADGATVPIYYESRLVKLALQDSAKLTLDAAFEEITEGDEVERKEKLKSKWAQMEALVGSDERVARVAADLVEHFERRLEVIEGKAMVVCMSRRIAAALYEAIRAIRPQWHNDADEAGAMKVVMTGSASDPLEWQHHIRNKAARDAMALRFKKPSDPLKLVIVRDMWLTGFDAPVLHTMYADKPMRGHGLMQAIARVNRVFKDKPGGLIVDYLGLAQELKEALATYTESGGEGDATVDQRSAIQLMEEKYEICCGIFHGFDRSAWSGGKPAQRLALLPMAQEHVLCQAKGKERLTQAVSDLSKAFALAVPSEEALEIRDDVGFFQAVRAALAKGAPGTPSPWDDREHAIRQLVSGALASDGVVDVFEAAGLKKPDISILSDEFLAEVRGLPQRNLAVELLRKLLEGEIKVRGRANVVQARSFAEMLDGAIRRYQNRAIETAQIIEELIGLAKDMKAADQRGEELGMTSDEIAFYDALEVNDSAVKVLGDTALRDIARELCSAVRANATIDWTIKETVRAKLRVIVKRILKKRGYPPDKAERATELVLGQAEASSARWAVR